MHRYTHLSTHLARALGIVLLATVLVACGAGAEEPTAVVVTNPTPLPTKPSSSPPSDSDPVLPAAKSSTQTGAPAMPSDLTFAVVLQTIDGDTVDVSFNGAKERIRLIGIDTPETKHPSKPVECFGREASARASELMPIGQDVLLEFDPTQGESDQYDRLLAFVWLPDGRMINYELVAGGYAFEYTYNIPYKYQTQFQEAEQSARTQQRGLWAPTACNGERKAAAEQPSTPPTEMPAPTEAPIPTEIPIPTAVPIEPRANCDPAYPDVCIPSPPPDLNCGDVAPLCKFRVLSPDPHGFDGNNDGIGCERCP